ncbi:MAG: sigma-70 family RNA polymerase sigma factor [Ruminococcaceae bacterium]|nr:sigma-70 family RNA polymerase sigma factor [Oscillospiraceae bacterium]
MSDMLKIWDECRDSIYKLCKIKLSSFPDTWEEVVSDVYSAFSDAVKKGTEISFPKAWIYKTANNIIAQKYKELSDRRNFFTDIDAFSDAKIIIPFTPDYTDRLYSDEEIERIADNILSECTEEEQLLLRLFYKEKKSYKEIALVLNKAENTVRQQNFRLTRRIKKRIFEEFDCT